MFAVFVAALLYDRHTAAIDRPDSVVVGGEYPGIDNGVIAVTASLQHDEVGRLADRQGLPIKRALEKMATGRSRGIAEQVALAMEQALAVFQRTQLVGSGDAHVGVRPY